MYTLGKYCAVLTVIVLAFGLAGCSNPTDGKPVAEVAESGTAPEAAAPEAANMDAEGSESKSRYLAFTENTTVGFVGSKVTGSHDGGFETVTGGVTINGDDLTTAKIEVTIDMNSTWSDNDRLTGHLKTEDFFHVEEFPESKFVSTKIAKTDSGYSISGDLTLHGVTKNITFPAQMSLTEGVLTANSEFSINRTDFGIDYKGMTDDLIRDDVLLKLDIEAVPEG